MDLLRRYLTLSIEQNRRELFVSIIHRRSARLMRVRRQLANLNR